MGILVILENYSEFLVTAVPGFDVDAVVVVSKNISRSHWKVTKNSLGIHCNFPRWLKCPYSDENLTSVDFLRISIFTEMHDMTQILRTSDPLGARFTEPVCIPVCRPLGIPLLCRLTWYCWWFVSIVRSLLFDTYCPHLWAIVRHGKVSQSKSWTRPAHWYTKKAKKARDMHIIVMPLHGGHWYGTSSSNNMRCHCTLRMHGPIHIEAFAKAGAQWH